MTKMIRLSVVVAAYNEENNIPDLHRALDSVDWAGMGVEPEYVFVDDHSSDRTPEILQKLSLQDSRVKWIRFSRNFGSHLAFASGLEQSTGDVAVIMAADLQDPPELIPRLVQKWREGNKVVWAVRQKREGERTRTRLMSRLYYALMQRYALKEMPTGGADFLLIDRQVIDVLNRAPEKNTSILALIQWLGFTQAYIEYTKESRRCGASKWTLAKKIKLAIDSFVSFSYAPIRLMSLLGICIASLGFLYALIVLVRAIGFACPVEGWSSLMCVVLVLSGVQLIMLGMLGEYLWRAYDETRGRPRYIIESQSPLKDV